MALGKIIRDVAEGNWQCEMSLGATVQGKIVGDIVGSICNMRCCKGEWHSARLQCMKVIKISQFQHLLYTRWRYREKSCIKSYSNLFMLCHVMRAME